MIINGTEYTYNTFLEMDEEALTSWIDGDEEYSDWAEKALKRKEIRTVYPRVKVYTPDGKPVMVVRADGKRVQKTVADKSATPTITEMPISFLSFKKAFIRECLGIEPVEQKKKETFHTRMAKALKK
jgi:hypothetical protein